MRFLVLCLGALVFGGMTNASTKFFVEPWVGISKFEYKTEVTSTFSSIPSETQRIANGFFLAGRAGVVFGEYFGGIEYFQGGPYNELQGTDTKTTNRLLGAVIGADFDSIRVSAAYFFNNTIDIDTGTTGDIEGKAARAGFGLPIAKTRFYANLDVIFHMIDDDTTTSSTQTTKFVLQTTLVSLSFPVDL